MFVYKGNNSKLIEATKLANEIINNENFYLEIAKKDSFDMATCSPKEISEFIKINKDIVTVNVKAYRKRFSRALGYFVKSRPFDVNINTAKLNRSMGSIVASLIHESIHMIDHVVKAHYFGHGDNKRKGKQNTAPYWIDNLAQSIVEGEIDFTNNESSKIVTKKSFFQIVVSFFKRLF